MCGLLLLLSSIFATIKIFANESALHIRWPKYWNFSFSFNVSTSNEYSVLISFTIQFSCSVMSDSLRPHGLYSLWNSPGQNTRVGSHSHLQGIFPTQGSNPGLLYCRWILYQLSHQRSPLEGLMLKLMFQYFGHLMWRADSFEKTLMLGKTEGRRKRGRQKMRWLDGITDSVDMS